MPIRASQKSLYPKNWASISRLVREHRAGWQCEFVVNGQRCEARHGMPHPVTGSKVVITTAHLDHDPRHCDLDNLRAACQACHLRYDAKYHAMNAAKTRSMKREAKQ